MLLTIAIPTFNRPASLQAVVRAVLQQAEPDCEVLILDNASDFAAAEVLEGATVSQSACKVRIERNSANLGATPNILRCIERATGKWIWTLGDDDTPTADAIRTIKRMTGTHPDAAFISFTSKGLSGQRTTSWEAVGLEDFVTLLDEPHGVNAMSCGVWRTDVAQRYLGAAYHYSYSMVHTFALLLKSTGDGHKVIFRPEAIIADHGISPASMRWAFLDFILGFAIVLELPMPMRSRRVLGRKFFRRYGPEQLIGYLLPYTATLCGGEARYWHRVLSLRVSPYFGFLRRLRFRLYGVALHWPVITWRAARGILTLARRCGLVAIDHRELEMRVPNARSTLRR
jgi:glycosyltransferase involved in cell wall biosynthesis